jgi:hypothetical protein
MSVMLVKTITIAKFTAETHSCRIRLSRKAKLATEPMAAEPYVCLGLEPLAPL